MPTQQHTDARFCSSCGGPLASCWIEVDARQRLKCTVCGHVHYTNPRVLVAAMITCGSHLLMCQRANEPAAGLWSPPTGFMEEHEMLEQATARETYEETGVRVDPDCLILHTIANLPFISEVYVTFRAEVADMTTRCGLECLQVRFFDESEIPWNSLAYGAMAGFLRLFLRERAANRFGIHMGHVDQQGKSRRTYELLAIGEKQYSIAARAAGRRGKGEA